MATSTWPSYAVDGAWVGSSGCLFPGVPVSPELAVAASPLPSAEWLLATPGHYRAVDISFNPSRNLALRQPKGFLGPSGPKEHRSQRSVWERMDQREAQRNAGTPTVAHSREARPHRPPRRVDFALLTYSEREAKSSSWGGAERERETEDPTQAPHC